MATPLLQLLRGMIDDPEVRAEFADGPMDYLGRHGYESIDAADVREALLIMADGAPTAEAVQLHAGGEAIDPTGADGLAGAAAGLRGALAAMTGDVHIDPAHLDGLDDAEAATDESGDEAGDDDIVVEARADDPEADGSDTDNESVTESVVVVDHASDTAALDGLTNTGLDPEVTAEGHSVAEPDLDEPDVDEPNLDDASFASPPDSLPADSAELDDWGDVI
jgi:hypothetical protein